MSLHLWAAVTALWTCLFMTAHGTGTSSIATEALRLYDFNDERTETARTPDELRAYFSPDGKALKNLLLGVYEDGCEHDIADSVSWRGSHRHGGPEIFSIVRVPKDVFSQVSPVKKPGNCSAVLFIPKEGEVAMYEQAPNQELRSLNNWVQQHTRFNVEIHNSLGRPVKIFWVDEGHGERESGFVQHGASTSLGTFLAHVFVVRDPDTGEMLDFFAIDGATHIELPSGNMVDCNAIDAENEDEATCPNKDIQFIDYAHDVWYSKRIGLNFVQPLLVHQVTKTGFEHHKMPPEAFDFLREWYEENQPKHEVLETSVGPCMNQHHAPSYVTHLGPREKERLTAYVKPLLEEWYEGDAPLEMTSTYGIRRYTDGAELRMHVDTVSTHVVSAIINVAQDVDEPWLLEILDHDGNMHELNMEAGDMVYYESAKLLHGRPKPLKGRAYSNVFIHFRPVDNSWSYDWI